MKNSLFLISGLLCLFILSCSKQVEKADPFEMVECNISSHIGVPFGMNLWKIPNEGQVGITGFTQSHHLEGNNDYGRFCLMPVTSKTTLPFETQNMEELELTPSYIKTKFPDQNVTVELAAGDRASMFKISYENTDSAFLIVDVPEDGSHVSINKRENRVEGFATAVGTEFPTDFRNYFIIKLDCPIVSSESISVEDHPRMLLHLQCTAKEPVYARVSSSFISAEQAERNLEEVNCDFNTVRENGKMLWNDALGRITVQGNSKADENKFYTSLAKSLVEIRKAYEFDESGVPVHYSPYNGMICKGYMYHNIATNVSDKSLLSLLSLLYPTEMGKIQESVLNIYNESGADNIKIDASILADAYIKGIKISDTDMLWEAATHGLNIENQSELATPYYNWCIYRIGEKLGKSDAELSIYAKHALEFDNGHGELRNFDPPSRDMLAKSESADYVFSALGFYPLCQGSSQYVIGAPIFKFAEINLENGKKITINTRNQNENNLYVKDLEMNGNKYQNNYLTHSDLINGADIIFWMSENPVES